jgi:hypothetical protein
MKSTSATCAEEGRADPLNVPESIGPWDVEEALTWVTYGFFRHLKHETSPNAAELSDWWDQLLAVQVAIGVLMAECARASTEALTDQAWQRIRAALARIRASTPA